MACKTPRHARPHSLLLILGVFCISKLEAADEHREFPITLQRDLKNHVGLGIDVDVSLFKEEGSPDGLPIVKLGETGLVPKWSAENPDFAVQVDDRIISVNDIKGSSDTLVAELQAASTLKMMISRKAPLPPSPEPPAENPLTRFFVNEDGETASSLKQRIKRLKLLKTHIESHPGGLVSESFSYAETGTGQGLGVKIVNRHDKEVGARNMTLAIPRSLVLSNVSAHNCTILGPLLRSGALDSVLNDNRYRGVLLPRNYLVLSLHLALEFDRGNASHFWHYLRTLPEVADVPLHWPEKSLRQLSGTGLAEFIHQDLRPAITRFHRKLLEEPDLKSSNLTLKTLARAYGLVASRSTTMYLQMPSLVPFFDMHNHATDQSVIRGMTQTNKKPYVFPGEALVIIGFDVSSNPGQEMKYDYGQGFKQDPWPAALSFFQAFGFLDEWQKPFDRRKGMVMLYRNDLELVELEKMWNARGWGDKKTIEDSMDKASSILGENKYKWISTAGQWSIDERKSLLPLEDQESVAPDAARLHCLLRLRAIHPDDIAEVLEAGKAGTGPDCTDNSTAWAATYPDTEAMALAELASLLLKAKIRLAVHGNFSDLEDVQASKATTAQQRSLRARPFQELSVKLCAKLLKNVLAARKKLSKGSEMSRDVADEMLASLTKQADEAGLGLPLPPVKKKQEAQPLPPGPSPAPKPGSKKPGATAHENYRKKEHDHKSQRLREESDDRNLEKQKAREWQLRRQQMIKNMRTEVAEDKRLDEEERKSEL